MLKVIEVALVPHLSLHHVSRSDCHPVHETQADQSCSSHILTTLRTVITTAMNHRSASSKNLSMINIVIENNQYTTHHAAIEEGAGSQPP